jgi:hypothetical protein
MLAFKNELNEWIKTNDINPDFEIDTFETRIQFLIQLIGNGVKSALTGSTDNIIREAPCLSSFGPNHGNDYLAGRGILMRYFGADEEKTLLNIDFKKNIFATVEAIWQTRDTSNNQFQPEFTTHDDDKIFIDNFKELWGLADDVYTWDIKKMKEQNKFGVCQSIGLDALGAAIKYL